MVILHFGVDSLAVVESIFFFFFFFLGPKACGEHVIWASQETAASAPLDNDFVEPFHSIFAHTARSCSSCHVLL